MSKVTEEPAVKYKELKSNYEASQASLSEALQGQKTLGEQLDSYVLTVKRIERELAAERAENTKLKDVMKHTLGLLNKEKVTAAQLQLTFTLSECALKAGTGK